MSICLLCDHGVTRDARVCDACGEERPESGWPQDPWLGRTLGGHYTLEERIGAGSHGIVFRARHLEGELDLGKVALKLLRGARRDRAARFLREAQSARAVQSPHALSVHAVGHTDEGLPYVVTPLLVGETLAQRLQRGPLDRDVARGIARDVCDALSAIHAAGLVHRDVKPANVFLGSKDFVTLLDFGIARSEQDLAEGIATIAGTPAYMAPEHRAGEPVDSRADIYALGVMLHEMIAGRRPHGEDDVTLEGVDGALVSRCLSMLPDERPKAEQLGRLLAEQGRAPATRTATLDGATLDGATPRAAASRPPSEGPTSEAQARPPQEASPLAWRPFAIASAVLAITALLLWSFDLVGEVARDTSVEPAPRVDAPVDPAATPSPAPTPSTQEVIEAIAAREDEEAEAALATAADEGAPPPSETPATRPRARAAPTTEEVEVPLVWRRVIDAPRVPAEAP